MKTSFLQIFIKFLTFIELFIIMAIIALLAAILLPVFNRARGNARRSTCQSNLEQLALGMTQYPKNYDKRFVIVSINATFSTAPPYPKPRDWDKALFSRTKNIQVNECPSATLPIGVALTSGSTYALHHYRPSVIYTASTALSVFGTSPTFSTYNT